MHDINKKAFDWMIKCDKWLNVTFPETKHDENIYTDNIYPSPSYNTYFVKFELQAPTTPKTIL